MKQDYSNEKYDSIERCLERMEHRVKKVPEWMITLQELYKEITEGYVSYKNDLKGQKPKENY